MSVQKVLLYPFQCKPRPSGVSLESSGLENTPQVPRNRSEVGQNHSARKAVSAYANRYFDQLRLDFAELGGYFPVPGTVNYFLRALLCSEMDTAKLFERSLLSFWTEI